MVTGSTQLLYFHYHKRPEIIMSSISLEKKKSGQVLFMEPRVINLPQRDVSKRGLEKSQKHPSGTETYFVSLPILLIIL